MKKLLLSIVLALAFCAGASAATPDTSATTTAGHEVDLSVTVASDPNLAQPLAYQWKKDGVAIAPPKGALEPLILTNVQVADSGRYTVTVSNSVGSTDSLNGSVITVTPALTPPSGAVVQPPIVK